MQIQSYNHNSCGKCSLSSLEHAALNCYRVLSSVTSWGNELKKKSLNFPLIAFISDLRLVWTGFTDMAAKCMKSYRSYRWHHEVRDLFFCTNVLICSDDLWFCQPRSSMFQKVCCTNSSVLGVQNCPSTTGACLNRNLLYDRTFKGSIWL